jgi:hypothetical protein
MQDRDGEELMGDRLSGVGLQDVSIRLPLIREEMAIFELSWRAGTSVSE